MCSRDQTIPIRLKVPADLSHTGKAEWRVFPIDRCIADLVRALQLDGIDMRSSCCGHGAGPGEIVLQDSRVLTIHGEARP